MPMRFGSPASYAGDVRISAALDKIARAGYVACEIWMEQLDASGEAPAALARQARALGLALTVHAHTADINTASRNAGIAAESHRQIVLSMEAAAALGAEIVVVHPGRRSSNKEAPDTCWPRLLDWLHRLDADAARLGVRVGLELMENRAKEMVMTPQDAARALAPGWRHIGLTFDIAHAHSHGDPLAFLSALDPAWVWHVHLSSPSAAKSHNPLGEGGSDPAPTLRALAAWYAGIVSLEGYDPARGDALLAQNMAWLRRGGFA